MQTPTECWTFETKYGGISEFITSSGRWDTMESAAQAAGAWLTECAENAIICTVSIKQIAELRA